MTTPGQILRTHTSPGQIHVMREMAPNPIRAILPGMCYRNEAISTRSEIQFLQVEGVVIGEGVTMADRKGTLTAFAPLILIFIVFYFLMIRPQQKKMKDHKAMLDALRRGDRVVTGGGIIGVVAKVAPDDREVTVEIAEGIKVKVVRETIATVLSKTEPVEAKNDDTKK